MIFLVVLISIFFLVVYYEVDIDRTRDGIILWYTDPKTLKRKFKILYQKDE